MVGPSTLFQFRDIIGRYSTQELQQRLSVLYYSVNETASTGVNESTNSHILDAGSTSVSNQLLESTNETDDPRAETPPPSYNEASSLPTYNEACILFPFESDTNNAFNITSNPLSSVEDVQMLYVNLPTDADDITLSSTADNPIRHTSDQNVDTQQHSSSTVMGSSLTEVYNNVINLFVPIDDPNIQSDEGIVSIPCNEHAVTAVVNTNSEIIRDSEDAPSTQYIGQQFNKMYTQIWNILSLKRNRNHVISNAQGQHNSYTTTSTIHRSEGHVSVEEGFVNTLNSLETRRRQKNEEDKKTYDECCIAFGLCYFLVLWFFIFLSPAVFSILFIMFIIWAVVYKCLRILYN